MGDRRVEDVVGENLLAIVGGLFVIIGAIFFLTMAIHNGWISELARVVLVLVGGAALFGMGLWLASRPESAARGELAFGSLHGVVTGSGVAVLFIGSVVGTRLYDVIPATLGLLLALTIGAAATFVAVRWESQDLAAFGILGALGSPVLVSAPATNLTLASLAIALTSSVAVVVRENWPWLLSATFIITAPQVAAWAHDFVPIDGSRSDVVVVSAVLVGYWLLMLGGALGRELLDPVVNLRTSSATVIFATTGAVVLIAQDILDRANMVESTRPATLFGFAALHLVIGALVLTLRRKSQAVAVFVIGLGSALLAAGIADQLDGSGIVAWWTAEAVALTWLYWFTRDRRAGWLSIGYAVLAATHALTIDAPPVQLLRAPDDLLASVIAVGSLLIGSLVAWQISPANDTRGAIVRRGASLASAMFAAYVSSIAILTAFSSDVVDHSNGISYDSTAIFAVSILWSVIGLAMACSGSVFNRLELSGIGVVIACFAPIYMAILQNDRGLDVVLWVALVAVAAGLTSRRWSAEYHLGIAAWFIGAGVLHTVFLDAPLLRVLSVGSSELLRVLVAAALVTGAAVGVVLLTARTSFGKRTVAASVRAGIEIVGLAMLTFGASAIIVTLITPDGLRAAFSGSGFSSQTDDAAQSALSFLWVLVALASGWWATRRTVNYVAWFALVVSFLVLVKTIFVGPNNDVVSALIVAALGCGLTWLYWRCGKLRQEAFAIPAAAAGGMLAVLTLINVPPRELLYGIEDVAISTILVGCFSLLTGGAAVASWGVRTSDPRAAQFVRWTLGATAVSLVYAVSVLTVGLLTDNPPKIEQDAQLALSIVWGVLGVGALLLGMTRRVKSVRAMRLGAFVLLGLAAAKVVLFDTSQLEATYRVLVFIGLGLLLLGGAFVDQKLRKSEEQ